MADCTLKLRGVVAAQDVKDPTVGSFQKGDKFSYVPIKGKVSTAASINKLIDGPHYLGDEMRYCERVWC